MLIAIAEADMKKHLSEIEMGAYIEGKLSPEKREEIERYLDADKKSRKEFAAIKRVITGDCPARLGGTVPESTDAPAHLMKKVIDMYPESQGLFDIVIGLVRDAVHVIHTALDINVSLPVPAIDMRSPRVLSPRMAVFTKTFNSVIAEFDIEKVAGDFCNIKVVVRDKPTGTLMNNLRVDLISNGRELVSDRLEYGEVLLEDVSPGRYSVRIRRNGDVLGELAIRIK